MLSSSPSCWMLNTDGPTKVRSLLAVYSLRNQHLASFRQTKKKHCQIHWEGNILGIFSKLPKESSLPPTLNYHRILLSMDRVIRYHLSNLFKEIISYFISWETIYSWALSCAVTGVNYLLKLSCMSWINCLNNDKLFECELHLHLCHLYLCTRDNQECFRGRSDSKLSRVGPTNTLIT